jgi:hypothetical protein
MGSETELLAQQQKQEVAAVLRLDQRTRELTA